MASLLKSLSNSSIKTDFRDESERQKYLHRFDGELYPKSISRRMLITSCIMSLAAIQAYYYLCYMPSIAVILVVIISINFWRKPTKGARRNLDIFNSISVTLYHMIYALILIDKETAIYYVFLVLCGSIPYICSKIAAKNGFMNIDSLFHCTMHLWGTCVNCWFYPKVYQFYADTLQ